MTEQLTLAQMMLWSLVQAIVYLMAQCLASYLVRVMVHLMVHGSACYLVQRTNDE